MRAGLKYRFPTFVIFSFLLAGIPARAYYHYTYFFNGSQSTPIRARFALASNGPTAITFLVNDAGPSNYGNGDTLGSLLGEVKQALAAWNQAPDSQLKLVFGGLEQYPQSSTTPGADITFQDLPPGLLGYASPNLPATPVAQTDGSGQFIPISRSTVVLTNDTSQAPGPTYTEGFFTTAVHEIGHALGLQHTWTGAAMSQSVVRNTNRARPIDADDIAALSMLYGASGWSAKYGSISGRVTYSNNGAGVSMASVVALPVNGPAVSALTNPDGTYTINGLPSNSYLLYVHPLPPDAVPANGEGLLLPERENGSPAAQPGSPFQTVFYPGTLDPQAATNFNNVNAGTNLSGINFSVRPQGSVSLYEVQTYSYIDPGTKNYTAAPPNTYIGISPAFANPGQGLMLISATANSGSLPVPQSVTILGGFAPAPNCASNRNTSPCFSMYNGALFGYFNAPPTPGTGPRHMVFNLGNDVYVLPDAVTLVDNAPPFVNSVNPNSDGTVAISGAGFENDTTIYFDGLQAPGVFNANSGSITVTPPAGNNGQNPRVAAYNGDGQNSLLLQYPGSPISNPPVYSYSTSGAPNFTAGPTSAPTTSGGAGFSQAIEIKSLNTHFVDGQVLVGLGTTDASVSRVWVLSPTHLLANLVVAPNAAIGSSEISVISGFQVMTQPFGFQIQAPNSSLPLINTIANAATSQGSIYPGASVTISGSNLANTPTSAQISLAPGNGSVQGAAISPIAATADGTQLNFQIPAGFPAGPALLTLNNGAGSISVVAQIAAAPPAIAGVTNSSNGAVDQTHAAGQGDVLTIQANGLDSTVASNLSRLQVTLGGVNMPVVSASGSQIQFMVTRAFGGTVVPLVVWLDGSASSPYSLLVK